MACVWQALPNSLLGLQNPSARKRTPPGKYLAPPRRAAAASSPATATEVPGALPEEYWLPPGEVSTIHREGLDSPADVFKCFGCQQPACQGPTGCGLPWRFQPGGYLRQILSARVYDVAEETPLEEASKLTDETGNTFLIKREDLQPVFSFKVRGAFNRLSQLTAEQLERGIICASAGNHAQGVALAARTLGCSAQICMPTDAAQIKVDAVRRLGGDITLIGQTYAEAQSYAQSRALEEGKVFISAFDDPYIIAGAGTVGAEILRHLTAAQMKTLHAIFVPVGGGGMIAGIAAFVKTINPEIKIFGVEPTGANSMAISLNRGGRVKLEKIDVFADGVAIKQPGAECYRLCRELLDGVLLVDNAATAGAVKDIFEQSRTILEPAGAVSVAGAKAYLKARPHIKGSTVVAVTSGANVTFDRLRVLSELAELGAGREALLATTITGRPGSFKTFIDTATRGTDLRITELRHRYIADRDCHVLWSVAIERDEQLLQLLERLNSAGFASQDVSSVPAAQVHLRHLVGGRTGSQGDFPTERLFMVDVPERQGAVRQLLDAISPALNVTLVHYRKTGNRLSPTLLGLEVPAASEDHMASATAALGPEGFTFNQLSTEASGLFNMFLQ